MSGGDGGDGDGGLDSGTSASIGVKLAVFYAGQGRAASRNHMRPF